MHLRYYLDKDGKRVYTMKTVLEDGSYTLNAHPGFIIFQIFEKIFINLFFQIIYSSQIRLL